MEYSIFCTIEIFFIKRYQYKLVALFYWLSIIGVVLIDMIHLDCNTRMDGFFKYSILHNINYSSIKIKEKICF